MKTFSKLPSRSETDLWLPIAQAIARKHGFAVDSIEAISDGSNHVACIDSNQFIKIFPTQHRHQWESERRAFHRLKVEKLSVAIPSLLAEGTEEDFTYLILSRVAGISLDRVWPQLSIEEKERLLLSIGRLMKETHSLPVNELASLDPIWKDFIPLQIQNAEARHRRLGMPEWFLRSVRPYLDQHQALIPLEPKVILTGEYTPYNLLVDGGPGNWKICGMIDFADVLVGPKEYDFLGPLLFLAQGNARLAQAIFSGYGLSPSRDLSHRLMVLAITHRYSHLQVQIRIPNWTEKVSSMDELRALIFPGI